MTKILKMISNRKVWPFLAIGIGALVLIGVKSWGRYNEPETKYAKILTIVSDFLEQGHYSPKKLDDNFSKTIFKEYLNELDPNRNIFLQSDIEKLRNQFETELDNEIRTGKTDFVLAVDQLYNKRSAETKVIYKTLLAQPFNFNLPETFDADTKDLPFAANEKVRAETWRKRLKYMVLERYSEAKEAQITMKDSANFVAKADSTLERESRERVLKIWNKTYDRIDQKFKFDEKFNQYVNVVAETMDPHTQFFPPVEKRAFDEQMSGEFFGIGAQLTDKDGSIGIATLVTGGPAWKSGEILPNDIILKVGQADAEPVDITGFEVTEAVKLIRGKKGTEVRLTVKKPDGAVKTVALIRDKIVQEETFARSAVIDHGTSKLGYIYLPEFYANFEDPNGARSAKDVAREITKLKEAGIDGIVMDLRFNGGGSLQDVIQMVGLFIEDGPVVQVKNRDGEASVYYDKDKSVLYSGPLVVMINEFSASASEIFAAAIQDYGRGMIVGTQSYGKGTVQRNIGIDPTMGFYVPTSELGSLKLTLQKFYRISGGSTQLNGVSPDITLPDNYEFLESREKDNPHALPYDVIEKANFKNWSQQGVVQSVKNSYNEKIAKSDTFKLIRSNAELLSKANDKKISLYYPEYLANLKKMQEANKVNESLQNLKTPMNIQFLPDDQARIEKMDLAKKERFMNWLKAIKSDRYLFENVDVLQALIDQEKLAKN